LLGLSLALSLAFSQGEAEAVENLHRLASDEEAGKWWSATDSGVIVQLEEEDCGDDSEFFLLILEHRR
jgi:hypothetical protein